MSPWLIALAAVVVLIIVATAVIAFTSVYPKGKAFLWTFTTKCKSDDDCSTKRLGDFYPHCDTDSSKCKSS